MLGHSPRASCLNAFKTTIYGLFPPDSSWWLNWFIWGEGKWFNQLHIPAPLSGNMPRQQWQSRFFSWSQSPMCSIALWERSYYYFWYAFLPQTLDIMGLIYMDDTELIEIAKTPKETMATVSPPMQDKASCWNGGMRATGGAQKINKCSWTLVDFVWDSTGQWHYHMDIWQDIKLQDEDSIIWTVEKLNPSDALTIIGVEQSLDSNMTAQVKVLEEKAMALGICIWEGYLHRWQVWQSFWTMIWPSLWCPLPATSLDEDQSEFITKQLYKMMLPAGGTNWHFPMAFHHAPLDFFGLELPRAIDHQGIAQIHKLLTHGSIDTWRVALLPYLWSGHNWKLESVNLFSRQTSLNMVFLLWTAGSSLFGSSFPLMTFCFKMPLRFSLPTSGKVMFFSWKFWWVPADSLQRNSIGLIGAN